MMTNRSILTDRDAMSIAVEWYKTDGPFKGMYEMVPIKAFRNSATSYSIRFKIKPDLGETYFRKFIYARTDSNTFKVAEWNTRPEIPDDVEPTESDQEALDAMDDMVDDDEDDELEALQDDADMDIEALRAMYAAPPPDVQGTAFAQVPTAIAALAADSDGTNASAVTADPPPPGPPDPKHPANQPLTEAVAKQLAAFWYSAYGPYRHLYTMDPVHAYSNSATEWSIKFKVIKDTDTVYFRRFTFEPDAESGCWTVKAWGENPELPPGIDYDPDDMGLEDHLLQYSDDSDKPSHATETEETEDLNLLAAEAHLSMEDLRRMYGYSEPITQVQTVMTSPEEHRTRKRRKSAAFDGQSDADKSVSTGEEDAKRAKPSTEPTSVDNKESQQQSQHDNDDNDDNDDDEFDPDMAGTEHLQQYFEQAMQATNELDSVVGITRKEIPVGEAYQAVIPALDRDNCVDERFLNSELQWVPPQGDAGNSSFEQQLDTYLAPALQADRHRDLRVEVALRHLFKHGFDTEEAAKNLNMEIIQALPRDFSPDEMVRFQQGLSRYGKKFPLIQKYLLPLRSCRELVDLYYRWKRTPAYLEWVSHGHGYGDRLRTKHVFAPGWDISVAPYDFNQAPLTLATQHEAARDHFLTSPRRVAPTGNEQPPDIPET
eukprot:TRINITY_DN9449_c0_g2_i1.p1 TRINITY_DN9449_c0_g2~~TRINITY_DN9449_c0_g2_i1.p1  ORF type:complete len:657 (+),score=162.39 TRINITY_DN9449_c0_g2_i1:68-2038(+)